MKRRVKKIDSIMVYLPKRKTKIRILNSRKHVLVTGNATSTLADLPDNCVDLIVTDPPYNRGLRYNKISDRMTKEKYYIWCKEWLKQCARVLHQKGSFYLISYPENNARLLSYIEDELKLQLKRWITWHYPTNIGHSRQNYTRSQRSIMFFAKSKAYTFHKQYITQHYKNPTVTKIKRRVESGSKGRGSYDLLRFLDLIELDKKLIDVIEINLLKNTAADRFTELHPCQLPLSLLEIFVKVSSNRNSILLDPFAGTFTLAAVAVALGRHSIGIEIDPKYVKLGERRLVPNGKIRR